MLGMPRSKSRLSLIVAAGALASLLAGCATPAGIEARNNTGRTLKVEYISVANDGTREVHGEGVVARDSVMTYKVDQADNPGNRVRFSVPELPMDEMTMVEVALPEKTTRVFDLQYSGGRLTAREEKKGANLPWVKDRTAD